MAPISKLDRAEALLREANRDTVSYEQLTGLFKALAQIIQTAKAEYGKQLDQKTLEYLRRYNGITQLIDETIAQLDADLVKKADANSVNSQLEGVRAQLRQIEQDIRADIPDELDLGPLELEVARIRSDVRDIPRVDAKPIWSTLNDFAESLKGVVADIAQLKKTSPTRFGMFTPRGFQLYVNGTKIGQVNEVNFPGATYSKSGGRHQVTITGSGALSVLTATGSIDDSNTTFTFTSAPTFVIVNGAMYRHGHGVSISGTTATLDNPAGTGGDVYGLG